MKVFVEPKDAEIEEPKACECGGELYQTGMYWASGIAVYECRKCGEETVIRFPSPI